VTTRPHLLTDSPSSSSAHVAESVDELAELREEVRELRADLGQLQREHEAFMQKVGSLFSGFRAVLSGDTTEPSPSASPSPTGDRRWDTWIAKLGGKQGEFIRAL
jgi:hypothetical protein